jgi:hypothetical protein
VCRYDTREIQREINGAQEAMGRAHALVDDTLYRDAKAGLYKSTHSLKVPGFNP